jgi:hypothetical protein
MSEREEEHDNKKGFRVVDRRRFTSEGEVRADAPADQPTPAIPPAPPPQAAAPKKADPRQAQPPPQREPEPQAQQESGIDFLSFCASLATNALAAMGALPEHEARGLPRSPELAREYIDILSMLQQKTRGNLSRQEDQALQQMVTELRLHFVDATQPRRR